VRTIATGTRATPLDPLLAGVAIEAAVDRDEIFELLLRATRARLGFAALLTVHHDHLRGWRILADERFEARGVETLQFSRNVPAFEAAIATSSPSVGPLATGEPFVDGLLELLGGRAPRALVLPVSVRMHAIALIVAHRGDAPFSTADVADLFGLLGASDTALARLMSTRARSAAERAPTRSESVDYEVEVSVEEDLAARRAALVTQRQAEAWPALADTIRELIRDGVDHGDPDEDEQLELLLELGRIEADRLGRPDRAIEAWRSAQTIDGGDDRVLDALEALFARQGRWLECVELLEKRIALIDDPGARITMLLNLAAIAREHLDDPGRAIEAYERILHAEPGHALASRQLEALHRSREEWGPLAAQMLDRASRDSDPKASVAALEAVAQMYENQVGDPRAAVLVWLTVLRRDPQRPWLVEEVDRLAASANAWDEVLAETAAVAEALERSAPRVAADLWALVGGWRRDRVADRAGAIEALERALRLDPEDPLRRSDLHAELGELYEPQPSVATEHYERALVGRPESAQILVALHRLYLGSEAWASLVEILPRLIDALAQAAPVAVLVDLHLELGTVLADQLGRPDAAAYAFQDALALEPRHAAAFEGLTRVYEATGQIEALLDATEARLDAASRAEQLQRYGDVAAAWHDHARLDRAAACWRKLIALDPHSAIAQQGLARTLRADHDWLGLATALRAQIALDAGAPDRLALLELADLLEVRLDDTDGATAVIQQVVALTPDDPAALDALARLHDRAGRLQPALEALDRLLAQTTDPRARADLLQRVGQVHLSARDAATARVSLVEAIALDRDNARAHEAMARVHLQQGELVAAGEELRRAARLSTSVPDTVRCLADAAWLYRYRLGDTERARECLHRILELDPGHADAKQALAELLHDNQEWESLWPHLEAQVARVKEDEAVPAVERHDLYTRAARCAVELGRFPIAMEYYELACAIATGPATLIERADALYRSRALEAAALSYQTLATGSATLSRADRIVVYRRLAQIQTELGRAGQAQIFHGKVLDLEPAHRETLEELAELHLAGGRFDDAIASLRTLSTTVPVAERTALLERIGDLYRHQLANPARATSTYLDALELDGGNRRILQRLLDLQSAAGQWTRAVETIARFLDHETDRARRAAYHLAAAEIRHNELRDTPGALEGYERALDELLREEPLRPATRQRALEVFHQIDTLHTAERAWKPLEQAYRRMIQRVPGGDPVLVPLWHALGELYRSRLEHVENAIQAFEIAHSLDPDKAGMRGRILTELYARIGAKPPEPVAVAAPVAALVSAPIADDYHALARTHLDAGRIDEAWCVCRALVQLKDATFDEELLYRKYQAHEIRKATGILDEDAWAHLRHADEDRVISAIFALVWESVVALRAGSPKSFDLKAKERIPVESDPRVVAKIFRHASRVLNVSLPEVYAQPRRPGSLLLANCVEKGRLAPAVIVGRDLMTGYRDTEIAAAVGAMLALLRPAYYLKLTLSTVEELEAALAAAARLVGRTVGRPELEPLTKVFIPEIQKHLTRPIGEALRSLVERLPDRPDLTRWRHAVDASAQRAGLLVAGELAAAARMTALAGPRPTQRVQELVAYAVSPGYFAARQHLGLAVSAPRRT